MRWQGKWAEVLIDEAQRQEREEPWGKRVK